MKSYVIIGMGLFGSRVAEHLHESGHYVLAIDSDMNKVEEVSDFVSKAVCLDAKESDALEEVGANKCDVAIIATTSNLSSTTLIAVNLKSFSIPEIYCKAKSEKDKQTLESIGGINVIIPEDIAAENLANKLIHPNVLEYYNLHNGCELIKIAIMEKWIGHSIRALNIRANYGINIVGITRNDEFITSFDPEFIFEEGDLITIISDQKQTKKFLKLS